MRTVQMVLSMAVLLFASQWTQGVVPEEYPAQKYLSGLGVSDESYEQASKNAQADLYRQIHVQIRSSLSQELGSEKWGNEEQKHHSIESKTSARAVGEIYGAQIVKKEQSEGKYYALAVLEKQSYGKMLRAQMQKDYEALEQSLLGVNLRAIKSRWDQELPLLNEAWRKWDQNAELREQIQALGFADAQSEQIKTELMEKSAALAEVQVQVQQRGSIIYVKKSLSNKKIQNYSLELESAQKRQLLRDSLDLNEWELSPGLHTLNLRTLPAALNHLQNYAQNIALEVQRPSPFARCSLALDASSEIKQLWQPYFADLDHGASLSIEEKLFPSARLESYGSTPLPQKWDFQISWKSEQDSGEIHQWVVAQDSLRARKMGLQMLDFAKIRTMSAKICKAKTPVQPLE